VPRAIAQFLRDKGQISGLQATTEGITEEMIQQQITTCVETCKQQVIEKRIAARLPALRFDREVLFPKKPKAGDLVSRRIGSADSPTQRCKGSIPSHCPRGSICHRGTVANRKDESRSRGCPARCGLSGLWPTLQQESRWSCAGGIDDGRGD